MQQPNENERKDIDPFFICSITNQIMLDPVIDCDGHTFERTGIETWFSQKDTCPLTGKKVDNKTLIPVYGLRESIDRFLRENPSFRSQQFVKDTLIDDLIKAIQRKNAEAVSDLINNNVEKVSAIDEDGVLKIMREVQKLGDEVESIFICLLEIFREKCFPFLQSPDSNNDSQFYRLVWCSSNIVIKNIMAIFKESSSEIPKTLLTTRRHSSMPTPLLFILLKGDVELAQMTFDLLGENLKEELTKTANIYSELMSAFEIIAFNSNYLQIFNELAKRIPNVIFELVAKQIHTQRSHLHQHNLYQPLPLVFSSPMYRSITITAATARNTSPASTATTATTSTTPVVDLVDNNTGSFSGSVTPTTITRVSVPTFSNALPFQTPSFSSTTSTPPFPPPPQFLNATQLQSLRDSFRQATPFTNFLNSPLSNMTNNTTRQSAQNPPAPPTSNLRATSSRTRYTLWENGSRSPSSSTHNQMNRSSARDSNFFNRHRQNSTNNQNNQTSSHRSGNNQSSNQQNDSRRRSRYDDGSGHSSNKQQKR